jgi:chromosome segregation ATPase
VLEFQESLAEKTQEFADLKRQEEQIQGQLATTEHQKQEKETRYTELERQFGTLSERNTKLQEELNQLKIELTALQNATAASATEQEQTQQIQIDELTANNAILSQSMLEIKESLAKKTQEFADLELQEKQIAQELATTEHQKQEKEASCRQLERQLTSTSSEDKTKIQLLQTTVHKILSESLHDMQTEMVELQQKEKQLNYQKNNVPKGGNREKIIMQLKFVTDDIESQQEKIQKKKAKNRSIENDVLDAEIDPENATSAEESDGSSTAAKNESAFANPPTSDDSSEDNSKITEKDPEAGPAEPFELQNASMQPPQPARGTETNRAASSGSKSADGKRSGSGNGAATKQRGGKADKAVSGGGDRGRTNTSTNRQAKSTSPEIVEEPVGQPDVSFEHPYTGPGNDSSGIFGGSP